MFSLVVHCYWLHGMDITVPVQPLCNKCLQSECVLIGVSNIAFER